MSHSIYFLKITSINKISLPGKKESEPISCLLHIKMHLFLLLQETSFFSQRGFRFFIILEVSEGKQWPTLNLKACIYWVFELTGIKIGIEILCQVVETGELMHTNLQTKVAKHYFHWFAFQSNTQSLVNLNWLWNI